MEYFDEVGDYIERAWPDVDPPLLLDRLDVLDEEDRDVYAQLIRGEIETDVWQNTIFRALTVGA